LPIVWCEKCGAKNIAQQSHFSSPIFLPFLDLKLKNSVGCAASLFKKKCESCAVVSLGTVNVAEPNHVRGVAGAAAPYDQGLMFRGAALWPNARTLAEIQFAGEDAATATHVSALDGDLFVGSVVFIPAGTAAVSVRWRARQVVNVVASAASLSSAWSGT
jgi:hypothetical protein